MSYSQYIRESRKKLGITQTDLTSPGISRVYITDIESGKATFQASIPNKVNRAYQIYKKLLEFSLIKSIPLDLDFDALFPDDHAYFKIKSCYKCIFELRNETELNDELLIKAKNYLDYDLESIKFYLIAELAIAYKDCDLDLAKKYFRMALIAQKYNINKHNLQFFKKTMEHYTLIATDEVNAGVLVEIIDYIITYSKNNYIPIETNMYYNMALFNKRAFYFEDSIKYITILENTYTLSNHYYICCEIVKAGSYAALQNHEKALGIFRHLNYMENDFDDLKLLYLGNTINFIVKEDLNCKDDIIYCIEKLNQVIERYTDYIYHNIFSNLGQGYTYLKEYDKAYNMFMQAFKVLDEEKTGTKYNLLMLISEAYASFATFNKLDDLIIKMRQINYSDLTDKEQLLYMKIILTLSHEDEGFSMNDLLQPLLLKKSL